MAKSSDSTAPWPTGPTHDSTSQPNNATPLYQPGCTLQSPRSPLRHRRPATTYPTDQPPWTSQLVAACRSVVLWCRAISGFGCAPRRDRSGQCRGRRPLTEPSPAAHGELHRGSAVPRLRAQHLAGDRPRVSMERGDGGGAAVSVSGTWPTKCFVRPNTSDSRQASTLLRASRHIRVEQCCRHHTTGFQ